MGGLQHIVVSKLGMLVLNNILISVVSYIDVCLICSYAVITCLEVCTWQPHHSSVSSPEQVGR